MPGLPLLHIYPSLFHYREPACACESATEQPSEGKYGEGAGCQPKGELMRLYMQSLEEETLGGDA